MKSYEESFAKKGNKPQSNYSKLNEVFKKKSVEDDKVKLDKQEFKETFVNNIDEIVRKAIDYIRKNGYQESPQTVKNKHGEFLGENDIDKVLRMLKERKLELDGLITLHSRNKDRQNELIDEYKKVDKLLNELVLEINRNK